MKVRIVYKVQIKRSLGLEDSGVLISYFKYS